MEPMNDIPYLFANAANRSQKDDKLQEPECALDCPLRTNYVSEPDPPLPPPADELPLTREEACALLYSPIKQWQTRLLRLDPGEFGEDLSATLIVVDITHLSGAVLHESQERVRYTALSYTWGEPVFPRGIHVNNIEVPITENLYAYLERSRDMEAYAYIWTDAVCINQLDLEEKAVQINSMMVIYEKAHQVTIWLGEEGPHTKLAVEYLHWVNVGTRSADTIVQDHGGHSQECYPKLPLIVRGIADMCSRDWVRRIWIKQEVWAAKELSVCCGSSKLSWGEYRSCTRILPPLMKVIHGTVEGTATDTTQCGSPISPIQARCLQYLESRHIAPHVPDIPALLQRQQQELNVPEVHRMLSLINESTDCLSTEPLDRVYALAGMAGINQPDENTTSVGMPLTIEIDYSIPVEVLYKKLAMSVMRFAGAYGILATDGTFGSYDGSALPSWTPDFRRSTRCKLLSAARPRSVRFGRPYFSYEEADEARMCRFRHLNPDVMSSVLCLEGYRIAKVIGPGAIQNATEIFQRVRSRLRQPGNREAKRAPIEDSPFLTPMAVEPVLPIAARAEHSSSWLPCSSNPAIMRYFSKFKVFAISYEARAGDIVAQVSTGIVPVVLSPMEQESGYFNFVSSAWLYADNQLGPFPPTLDLKASWNEFLTKELIEFSTRKEEIVPPKEIFRVK